MLSGFYLRFGAMLDETVNRRVQGIAQAIRRAPHPALTDVIPGYSTLYLEYDSRKLNEAGLKRWLDAFHAAEPAPGRQLAVSVVYDGPDLAEVAGRTGLSVAEVVARHSAREYHVYALGFTPGLAFMGDLDTALRLPRRDAPRAQVPAQSVAIANGQTTVYPVTSPGGWHLLGRTVEPVYKPTADQPFLFAAGDRVRFQPVSDKPDEADEGRRELLPEAPHTPLLQVAEPGLLDVVVDRGRFLAGHLGFARSGPLDVVSAASANRLVGNDAGAALLELNLQGGVYKILADGVLAFTGSGMQARLNGEGVRADFELCRSPGRPFELCPHVFREPGVSGFGGGAEVPALSG